MAELLHKHPASIYRLLSVSPHRLPPPVARGRKHRVLWLTSVVLEWLARESGSEAAEDTPAAPPPVKRGRPRKAEQIRRREAVGQGVNHGL